MDVDFGTIIYVILAVIYFIIQSNAKSKKKREQAERFEEKETTQRNTGRRPTFEELLEEFTGQRLPQSEPAQKPVVVEQPAEVVESKPYRSSYEIAQEKAAKKKKEAELEAAKIRSKFNDHFDHFEIEEEEVDNDYAEMFGDLDSTKRAFVASEIFNRKF